MLGSAEPSLFEQPNFMSSVHAIRNASPYFFYLTCELSAHYARYVLVHAYCQCPALVTAFSCCATWTVFSLRHRFLWCCMSATCGLFVTKNGALVAKGYCRLRTMLWRRNSYNSVWLYMLTSGRTLCLTAFARRWHENNGRLG